MAKRFEIFVFEIHLGVRLKLLTKICLFYCFFILICCFSFLHYHLGIHNLVESTEKGLRRNSKNAALKIPPRNLGFIVLALSNKVSLMQTPGKEQRCHTL